ncbi:hypothetical protein BDZ89DRAFT_1044520 [Hymenopellis radicata]|nr:hypothetical protein BDZ89DRAFT_1044520 [Hymenopellis radicata]
MAHQQIQTSTLTERLMLRTDKTNYASFKIHIEEYIAGKGISGYLDASIQQPPIVTVSAGAPIPAPTPVYSTTPSRDEWNYRNGVAKSIIITNIVDPIAIGLQRDGTAAEVWVRLEKICLPKSDAALSLAEEQFNNAKFTGTSRVELDEHIADLHAKAARLRSLGKIVPDKDLKNTISRSLPKTPEWFGVSGSLYAALSSEDVIALIQAHAIHIGLPEEPALGPAVNANAYAASGGAARRKEGQFPANFGRREQPQPQANQVIYPSTIHRVLAAQSDTIENGEIIVNFMDETEAEDVMPALEYIDSEEYVDGGRDREMEGKLGFVAVVENIPRELKKMDRELGFAAMKEDDMGTVSPEPVPLALVMVDLLAPMPGSANPFMLVMQDGPASKSYALLDDTRETTMIQAFDDYRRRIESNLNCRIRKIYADAPPRPIKTTVPKTSSTLMAKRQRSGPDAEFAWKLTRVSTVDGITNRIDICVRRDSRFCSRVRLRNLSRRGLVPMRSIILYGVKIQVLTISQEFVVTLVRLSRAHLIRDNFAVALSESDKFEEELSEDDARRMRQLKERLISDE